MVDAAPKLRSRVLAVDDEVEILNLYRTFLEGAGYEVVTLDNAKDCLDFLNRDTADILLLDVNMPGIDGLRVLEMIRMNERTRDMRVIIVSARRDEATVREAVRSKCDGFVVKPFRLKDLAQRIAMELFTITHQEIRILCRDLVTIRTNVFREKGFEEFNSQLWDPYPVKYREMMLCVMLPRGIRPAHFARALDEELEKRVVLLLKHPGKWKKIFPPKRYV